MLAATFVRWAVSLLLLFGGIIAFSLNANDCWGRVLSTIFILGGLVTIVINMFSEGTD